MKTEQNSWIAGKGWSNGPLGKMGKEAQLVLVFGGSALMKEQLEFDAIKQAYPNAHLLGCSTAGEILGTQVRDDSLALTAVKFNFSGVQGTQIGIAGTSSSYEAGKRLANAIEKRGLRHLFVLSDGLSVNGSELVKGLASGLPKGVSITGGLSGDGPRFKETFVFFDAPPETGIVAAIGLYGDKLKVGYGSLGGWDPFGPYRTITGSKNNVLYEMDGKNALDLYKEYLGDQAKGLPATGLLFPLEVKVKEGDRPVVRTILSVDEKEKSMTFAGDVPEGATARLMKANFERLVDGSLGAAQASRQGLGAFDAELAILISCVGRKLVLAQKTEEEVEAVRDVLGSKAALTGFYSYGEIAPFVGGGACELHNQTMTITALAEER
ncbi:MAG TPA: FIST N-terminal domain-containing protein [Candidatus Omnitrophota bacterium]|nr:FIST N-terminal domain-containing protein [Candidatus Omnitrophota bacterium]